MQKLHNVTLNSPDHAPFVVPVMGVKTAKNGRPIPLSKGDAVSIAYAKLFDEKYAVDLSDTNRVKLPSGGYAYVVNVSAATLSQCSELYRERILSLTWKATVETTTFSGMAATAVGRKRDANGKKIRKRNKKSAPKNSAPAPKDSAPAPAPKDSTLDKLAKVVKK